MEGREGRGMEVRREMLVLHDGASGVVEILQQRTSPLLSNVHLILQILQDDTIGFMLRTTSHDINLVNSTIT